MDIKKIVKEFMVEELKDAGFNENISDDASLIDSYILDSLSILTLISFMDEKFGIIPADDELKPEKFETVNLIVEFIKTKVNTDN